MTHQLCYTSHLRKKVSYHCEMYQFTYLVVKNDWKWILITTFHNDWLMCLVYTGPNNTDFSQGHSHYQSFTLSVIHTISHSHYQSFIHI